MINRDVRAATRLQFDVVVVGGGIYGASVLQEAARRGLSACLCEAADFGGGTSWNSLRIVHGGLRYLQALDLRRFFQSVCARRRVARQFPSLVRPLQCLMPLYGQGMKRAPLMRMALLMNDALSSHRNAGLAAGVKLPRCSILDASATRRAFPLVRTDGLQGAATWHDYFMVSSERILIELLHDACLNGAIALNHATVTEVLGHGGRACGVRARDGVTGEEMTITGRAIVNCSGPSVRELIRGATGNSQRVFRPSLAFNLLLDIDLQVDTALAVAPPATGSQVLFLVPQPGSLLAGTMHLPRPAETREAVPTEAEIARFLSVLNQAIPGLDAGMGNVKRILAGLLPAAAPGSADLATREIVLDHGRAGGLPGLYSVSGVKFTTAGDVATKVLNRVTGTTSATRGTDEIALSAHTPLLTRTPDPRTRQQADTREAIRRVADQEAVRSAHDLVLRRSNWAITATDLDDLLAYVGQEIGTRDVPGAPRAAVGDGAQQ